MAFVGFHHPSSWSKRPGTWINDVLAFCRVGRKYVGCIELLLKLFCVMSHYDLGIWRTNLKLHRVNARGTAYIQAMFSRNSLKNNRENGIQLIRNC